MPRKARVWNHFLILFVLQNVQPAGAEFPAQLEPESTIQLPSANGGPLMVYPRFDEPRALIVPLKNGSVVMLSPQGEVLWETKIGDDIITPVAVGQIDGEGAPEIIAVADSLTVAALSEKGTVLWEFPLPGKTGSWRGPTCVDFDLDGKDEILIANNSGWQMCLSGEGKVIWRMHADNFTAGPAAVGDVDGDGKPEVVYGTENKRMLCLDGQGRLNWLHHAEGKFGRTNVALVDLDGDGLLEAAWSTSFNTVDSRVYVAHAVDGAPFWSVQTILHGYGAISVGDVDGDGTPNLVYAERANTVYAYSGEGEELWRTTTGGRGYMYSPHIADVDGDGQTEVLAAVRDQNENGKSFFILEGKSGKILGEYPLPGRATFPPVVCDFDRDGRIELLLLSNEGNEIDVCRFGAKTGAKIDWPSTRRDEKRTGCYPLKTKAIRTPDWPVPSENLSVSAPSQVLWGENPIGVTWPSHLPSRCFAATSVVDPAGVRTGWIRSIDPEKPQTSLPVELSLAGDHQIEIVLWDESKVPAKPVAKADLTLQLEGSQSLAGWTSETLASVRDTAAGMLESRPSTARMLYEQAAVREGSLAGLAQRIGGLDRASVPERDRLAGEVNSYRKSVEDLSILARLAKDSPHPSLAVWEDPNPWDFEPPLLTAPLVLPTTPTIEIWALGSETEYRALSVVNLRPNAVDVQFRLLYGGPLQAREVVQVPRADGSWVADALPAMSQSRTLHLAPGEVRQVWFDVSTEGLSPGTHEHPIEVLPIGAEGDRFKILFKVEVSPVSLADAPEFAVCNWTSPSQIRRLTEDPGFVDHVLKQGMNVFTIGAPSRKCDAEGNLVGEPDWSSLDRELDGLDSSKAILLVNGPHVATPPEVERGSGAWKRGLQNAMRELAAHLASRGYPLKRWAYYPVDEPGLFGGTQIVELRRIAEPAKEVAPEIQFYADPAGGVTRENFRDLVDEIDVWSPELAMLRRNADLIDFFLETKDWLWCYEAPDDVKTLLPLGYYRAQPLTATWMGFVGAGHWVFGYNNGGNDLWLQTAPSEYGDHYLDGSRIVQSRRWLAFMDGAEDARLLLLLKSAVAEAKRRGVECQEVAEAGKLLGPELRNLIRKQWDHDDITRYLVDYELELEGVNNLRRKAVALVDSLRARIMDGEDKLDN